MSRILFVCSGNTCRSPMAEALARRTFGPSHTIVSAGAECSGGDPPAANAVIAMREIGINIEGHRSNDINSFDLSPFDMIVIFQPSAAETIALPANVSVEHLAVMDPYGQPLEVYRTRLRSIECGIPRLYAADALRRKPEGSHLLGIYNKSAKEAEKQIVTLARHLGTKARPKATLGEAAVLLTSHATKADSDDLREIGLAATTVNNTWVGVKHRDDPTNDMLMDGLQSFKNFSRGSSCTLAMPNLPWSRHPPASCAGLRLSLMSNVGGTVPTVRI